MRLYLIFLGAAAVVALMPVFFVFTDGMEFPALAFTILLLIVIIGLIAVPIILHHYYILRIAELRNQRRQSSWIGTWYDIGFVSLYASVFRLISFKGIIGTVEWVCGKKYVGQEIIYENRAIKALLCFLVLVIVLVFVNGLM